MTYFNRSNSILVNFLTTFFNSNSVISIYIINYVISFCIITLIYTNTSDFGPLDTAFVIENLCCSSLAGLFLSLCIYISIDINDYEFFKYYNSQKLNDYKKTNKEININKSNDIIIDNISKFIFKNMIDLMFIFVYIVPLLSLLLFIFDVNYFYLIIGIFGWLFPSIYITTKIINLLNR